MSNDLQKLKRSLVAKLLLQVAIEIIVYLIFLFVTFMAVLYFYTSNVWYGNEPLYIIGRLIADNFSIFLVAIISLGLFTIVAKAIIKSVGYTNIILKATENIYKFNDDDLIKLPNNLKIIESYLNELKLNYNNSIRIAKEAEQRKNDLIVYLAHDLKTPLTSIVGYLTLLEDEKEISEQTRDKFVSITLNKAYRLEELINEFFEITRFNLSNINLEISNVNLSRMLEQVTFEAQPLLAEKSLKCELVAVKDVMYNCDSNKILRVFDNLLNNAINYSFENTTITVKLDVNINSIQIMFKNNGNTIPEEKLERIFTQFFRLDNSRGTKSGGAGLGLAIAKEIVTLHNGSIKANSHDNEIAFVIHLPII